MFMSASLVALIGAFFYFFGKELFHPKRWPLNIAVLFLIMAVFSGVLWWGFERRIEHAAQTVSVTAFYDPAECADLEFPIAVELTNLGAKRWASVAFTLKAHLPGADGEQIYKDSIDLDLLTEPGATERLCAAVPSFSHDHTPADMVWSATPYTVVIPLFG